MAEPEELAEAAALEELEELEEAATLEVVVTGTLIGGPVVEELEPADDAAADDDAAEDAALLLLLLLPPVLLPAPPAGVHAPPEPADRYQFSLGSPRHSPTVTSL